MKKFLILFSVAIFSLCIVSASIADLWVGNGHSYEVILEEGISWTAAGLAADALPGGWYLATITSQGEEDFIEGLLGPTNSRDEYWLGGYQDPPNSSAGTNWKWITGEAWGYTHWGVGQPDDWSDPDHPGSQYFLAIDHNGSWGWDDNTGTTRVIRGYVVESVPEPTTLLLLGFGLIGLAGVRRKLKK